MLDETQPRKPRWTYAQVLAEAERLDFEGDFRGLLQAGKLDEAVRNLPIVMSQHLLDPVDRQVMFDLASRTVIEMAERVLGRKYEVPVQEGIGDA